MAIEGTGGRDVGIGVMRELRGVLDSDAAQLAGLIVMEPLGTVEEQNLKQFRASEGDLELDGIPYPRLQLLIVKEILDDRRFHSPGVSARVVGQGSLEVSSGLD